MTYENGLRGGLLLWRLALKVGIAHAEEDVDGPVLVAGSGVEHGLTGLPMSGWDD